MRSLLMVSVAIILFVVPTISRGNVREDGVWWGHLSDNQKIFFVSGFIDGLSNSAIRVFGVTIKAMENPQTKKFDPKRMVVAKWIGLTYAHEIGSQFNSITTGTLKSGVDKLYSDYRNTQIGVESIIAVAADSINGASDQQVERELEKMRIAAATH